MTISAPTGAQYEWASRFIGIKLVPGDGPASKPESIKEDGGNGADSNSNDMTSKDNFESFAAPDDGGSPPGAQAQSATSAVNGTAKKPPAASPHIDLKELAKWPQQAHEAWKGLDEAQRTAVVVQMASIYGGDFAKAFVAFTKSGARLDTETVGPHFPERPEKWYADHGYKLAQHDSVNNFWVHPSGHDVMASRDSSPWGETPDQETPPEVPPPNCEPGDAAELLKMTLDEMKEAIKEDKNRQTKALAQKEAMDNLNITSDEFRKAYDSYVELLKDAQNSVKEQLESVDDAKASLEQMCADTKPIEQDRGELEELQIWFDVQSGLLDMEGRKPIRVKLREPAGGDIGC